jgi:AcrR family transcriptional regulator
MRITAETKRETRQRILDEARALFGRGGFEAATTRDLAAAAGIATGTLFSAPTRMTRAGKPLPRTNELSP